MFKINSAKMFIKTNFTLKKLRKTLKKGEKLVEKMTTASKSKLRAKLCILRLKLRFTCILANFSISRIHNP